MHISILLWNSPSVSPDRYFWSDPQKWLSEPRTANSLWDPGTHCRTRLTSQVLFSNALNLNTWVGLYRVTELFAAELYPELMYYSCISVIVKKTWSWLSEPKLALCIDLRYWIYLHIFWVIFYYIFMYKYLHICVSIDTYLPWVLSFPPTALLTISLITVRFIIVC